MTQPRGPKISALDVISLAVGGVAVYQFMKVRLSVGTPALAVRTSLLPGEETFVNWHVRNSGIFSRTVMVTLDTISGPELVDPVMEEIRVPAFADMSIVIGPWIAPAGLGVYTVQATMTWEDVLVSESQFAVTVE